MSTKVLIYTSENAWLSDPLSFDFMFLKGRIVDKGLDFAFGEGVHELGAKHHVIDKCVFPTGAGNKIEANSTKIL